MSQLIHVCRNKTVKSSPFHSISFSERRYAVVCMLLMHTIDSPDRLHIKSRPVQGINYVLHAIVGQPPSRLGRKPSLWHSPGFCLITTSHTDRVDSTSQGAKGMTIWVDTISRKCTKARCCLSKLRLNIVIVMCSRSTHVWVIQRQT